MKFNEQTREVKIDCRLKFIKSKFGFVANKSIANIWTPAEQNQEQNNIINQYIVTEQKMTSCVSKKLIVLLKRRRKI